MTIMMSCLFIVALMPYLSKLVVAVAMSNEGAYDNNYPREQQKRLTGFGARAVAAHQNSFEALLIFAVATLACAVNQETGFFVQFLSVVFMLSRCGYHVAYLMNLATIRSMIWFIGFFSAMTMMVIAIP